MYSQHYTGQILQRYSVSGMGRGFAPSTQLENFVHELSVAFEIPGDFDPARFSDFPMEVITDYIRKTHRHYLFRKLPEMEQSINLLLQDYNDSHPLLHVLRDFYSAYKTGLSLHICEEENHLLPYVDFLLNADKKGFDLRDFIRHTKRYSLSDFMEDHHDDHETELRELRKTILAYRPPSTNSTPYRILIQQLDFFDRDLTVHGLIEDHVLIPRMRAIESRLKGRLAELQLPN
jgi:regulator of cell morphogenesis and NO signaling